ncbi:MAG: CopG family ribbon-helix-helix protein [Desulfurococcales archaeon]|nr:CopG family ribbon-helix-helix protein [Desulfurococcales archaeon]
MAIISVSIPDDQLKLLDKVVEEKGFSSRSEAVRHALLNLAQQGDEGGGLRIIIVLSDHEEAPYVDRNIIGLIHGYMDELKGLYHQIVDGGLCITIAITRDSGDEWRILARKIRKLRGVKNVVVTSI